MVVKFGRVRSEAFVNFSTCYVWVVPNNKASFGIFLGSVTKFHSMVHNVLFAAGWDILLLMFTSGSGTTAADDNSITGSTRADSSIVPIIIK